VIILVIVIASLAITIQNIHNTSLEILIIGPLPDKDLLRKFLESQYIEEAGLLRASVYNTTDDSHRVWIANDNVLAARALAVLNSPLAKNVLTTLNNKYNGGWNGKIDILLGRDIPDMFYARANISYGIVYSKRLGFNLTIYKEVYDYSRPMLDWYKYADLLVYRALDYLLHGSMSEAEEAFLNLTSMWDGYGFYDIAVNATCNDFRKKVYAVYKCALFVYLYRALYYAGSDVVKNYRYILDKCLEIIAMAQDTVYGGIYTSYETVNGEIVVLKGNGHDMNTETTSIVVLALYSDYPEIIGEKAWLK